ncbi:GNAT family N-acetyltransferase [Pedobacter sandarakinus]|uniref:GNAT family N-acetyltransferase n=1 Tax=Pedobacter sandarakinus TaxID=353156 RepID=UPI0022470C38|nr:GNAT family N-acetyltransferase [Pedobacter sandarakinus]MCX2573397.1 GNAT family N-acetyltransferase [Pedobacter sandarakinus]
MRSQKNPLSTSQKAQIVKIWNLEYPESLNFSNAEGFDQYLMDLSDPTHYIYESESGEPMAWACKFIRDNDRWFAIILDKKIQGKGIGTRLLNKLKENECILNAWVIDKKGLKKLDGKHYKSPLKFYLKNGFVVDHDTRLENEKLSAVKITWKP